MLRTALLLAALVLPSASAAPALSMPAAVRFTYEVHAVGLTVAQIEATLITDGAGYHATLAYHTVGVYGLMLPAHSATQTRGAWTAGGIAPEQYSSAAVLRGEARHVLIDYVDGSPQIRALVPDVPGRWQPVPVALRADTMDTLSAAVLLIRHVATTGSCDDSARTYDGHRLTALQASTVGDQKLPHGDGSPYNGTALRCDFTGQQIAGFEDNDTAFAHKPHHGTAWFAQVMRGEPSLPVRISFETRWFGDAVAVMTGAQAIPR